MPARFPTPRRTGARLVLAGTSALVALSSQPCMAQMADSLRTPDSFVQNWKVARILGLTLAYNGVMTLYGRYIMKEPGDPAFVVSIETIENNLKNGLEWDDNTFSANNFRHPYQGALYFGAARANGYDFYESAPWAFVGSWLWEYTGEGHQPAYNDMVNTTLGGIAIGEGLHRLSNMVLDNTATGGERNWREIGGLLVSPLRGVNRLLTGEWFTVHQNPPDRSPSWLGGAVTTGTRTLGEEKVFEENRTKVYLAMDLVYGDPFVDEKLDPFDAFRFGVEITFDNKPKGMSRINTNGIIAGGRVGDDVGVKHRMFLTQHLNYYDNEAYTFGGQSLAASLLSNGWKLGSVVGRSEVHAHWIILGGVKSDYDNITGREYDYGPGLAYGLRFTGRYKKTDIFAVANSGFWVRSLNGTEARHYTNVTMLSGQVPIRGNLSLGAQYFLYLAERNYADYEDVSQRSPELRLFASFGVE